MTTLSKRRNGTAKMTQAAPHTIQVGSGIATQSGIGNKAALLDRAAEAGLPVPMAYILTDAMWQHALTEQLVIVSHNTVVPIDADALRALFSAQTLPRFVAVRSAFSAEDGTNTSLAGFFASQLWVTPHNTTRFAEALSEVWSSSLRYEQPLRRDVLVMGMVAAQHAGVAFTESEFEDDLINYTAGTAEELVGGRVTGETLSLAKLRTWERTRKSSQQLPFIARLQALLRDVRQVFGAHDWDIEWADDGDRCWLIQIRSITGMTRRNEAFTVANHKEILPDPPSRFMTSLVASCANGLFAYYRRFDPELPLRRPFIEVFEDRPFINLSLMTDMMRILGLPSHLVTNSIGGESTQDSGVNIGRVLRKSLVLSGMGIAQLRSVPHAQKTMQTILTTTKRPGTNFSECIETLRWLYTTLVTEMFSLVTAMSGPTAVLRQLGVLSEHSAWQQTIATTMYTDLVPLQELVTNDSMLRETLERGELPKDSQFQTLWNAYLVKHGHRGIYESDIARPRYREDPTPLLSMLLYPPKPAPEPATQTLLGRMTSPLWWQASRAMQTREEIRYTAMVGFARIREALLTLADGAVARGVLPSRESLWMLDIAEVSRLDQGWVPDAMFWEQRTQQIARSRQRSLPDLFHRFDDLDQNSASQDVKGKRRLKGISLTTGTVRGRVWVLDEPCLNLPEGFTSEHTILVARSVDAGWIPVFARVAGVVVETGGDLSHGSIILREIGLPAITNVSRATQWLRNGDAVLLQAGSGTVERIVKKT
ncbi:MAG: PEP-utilizing enzyme [Chloroflexota bacterium]